MAKLLVAAAVLALFAAVSATREMLGGFRDVDVNSPGVKDALSFAIYEMNKADNDIYASRPLEVTRAQSQLVNGYNYEIDVTVGRTNCRKPATNPSTCLLHKEPNLAMTKKCNFKVFSCPWKSEMKMKSFECN